MTIKVGINGFGRMGRLTLRAALEWPEVEFIKVNDVAGDAKTHAHLLEFDSVHGRLAHSVTANENSFSVGKHTIAVTNNKTISDTDWSDCDVVIEASGKMKTTELLNQYLAQGVKRVVVTAPVKEDGILNVVMGVNDNLYNPDEHKIVTAASCTTNCLAPIVKVLQEKVGIKHGSMTTIHDITNTQTIIDAPHKDLRRARSCGTSLIPTTTGSATAITHIFPELKGKLNGHAVRVPLTNASITDCVFELERGVTAAEVNEWFAQASKNELAGVLGYEEKPLVSIDYKTDPRSSIIDALSTMVINNTQLKLYAWYDNEWGYANRTAELMLKVAKSDLV
ncbi:MULTISPECIES: ArsJ-associated glyceraldehyde-3-phosphate dehydrogenase [Pseudoalteromonas]|jgi:glyceraldehyde 3-phosphate dehydrogenase|uniref:Glyceraldehyde-3-phosphate dehydrogenase n=1 Tax=Pseudoalteromonas atlantica TaxID=288 RepID=A0ABQ0UB91_PSEAF|nr:MULTISPECIES: ArsJ-associated glyceraldehyde-3-phosphate dehydrogenase [Pseudoalteromonas]MAJ41668.1 aldehyde dehydrogenase [Pseudoalteromonadaceae bacterium]MDY6889073.1 ArsJ-associated glyceraldehyde-3-phosphate dehydrogenase [Pseudomonadota bacterium]OUX82360.1 MAG: aldehyde dehydrogenase [Pseudoalteromonas sp. TMED43]GEK75764.1 glyceraldehyde-3-phosphate dehydrogenase [Pseudoalteromonas atlantica]ETJ48016.1 glyceraldehyde-3-phosphate dehydrogenase [Pseudoalteromonas agarivorans]|tara:strand:- start:29486 stop:30496 length:1011 start_codon:yes stop_codon:yes gene_type:complete